MRKSNKKGFTIVELVIVIAIIAILAAVLIPTFAGLIKKANTSADIQGCRQMNTYLAVNEVTADKTIVEVYNALKEGGMDAKDYTPLSSDTYYYWDSVLNRILYTDKNKNVIYPEEYKDVKSKDVDSTNGHQWYSLNGKIDTSNATVDIPTGAPSAKTELAAASAADLVKIAEYVRKYQSQLNTPNEPKTIVINITGNMNLNGADIAFTEGNTNTNTNVTINGNGYTITGLYISDNHSGLGYDSNGTAGNNYGGAMFGYAKNLTVTDLTIDSAVVGSYNTKQAAIFVSHVTGDVTITNVKVKNSTVYGKSKTGLLFGFVSTDNYEISISNVIIENSKVYSDEGECGLLFGVATGSTSSGNKDDNEGKITFTTVTIDDKSSANINPDKSVVTISGKQYVDDGGKYKCATAKIGFIGIGQGDLAITTLTDEGLKYDGKATLWKAVNTTDRNVESFNLYAE